MVGASTPPTADPLGYAASTLRLVVHRLQAHRDLAKARAAEARRNSQSARAGLWLSRAEGIEVALELVEDALVSVAEYPVARARRNTGFR